MSTYSSRGPVVVERIVRDEEFQASGQSTRADRQSSHFTERHRSPKRTPLDFSSRALSHGRSCRLCVFDKNVMLESSSPAALNAAL